MQRVIKNIFLINDKLENNLKFWVLLGPFFLFITTTLASFDFAIASAVSLFLCYRFKFKGLYLSLIALVGYSFYTQVNLSENHLWNLGLEISIALGLIISAFGFDEIKNYLLSNDKNKSEKLINLKKLLEDKQKHFETFQENLQKNINILKSDLNSKAQKNTQLVQENENLKKTLQDHVCRKDYLLNELDQKVKEIETLQIKKDELYEKLSFLKDEEHLQEKNKYFQKEIGDLKSNLALQKEEKRRLTTDFNNKVELVKKLEKRLENVKDYESLLEKLKTRDKEIEKLKLEKQSQNKSDININKTQEYQKIYKQLEEKETQIQKLKIQMESDAKPQDEKIKDNKGLKEYENKMKELNRMNSLYSQLKDQFEEKQLVLHKTRQELFQVNEKLTALQGEQDEDFKDLSEYEKAILSDLDVTSQELSIYKEENMNLEKIVDTLLSKKSTLKKEEKNPSQDKEPLF